MFAMGRRRCLRSSVANRRGVKSEREWGVDTRASYRTTSRTATKCCSRSCANGGRRRRKRKTSPDTAYSPIGSYGRWRPRSRRQSLSCCRSRGLAPRRRRSMGSMCCGLSTKGAKARLCGIIHWKEIETMTFTIELPTDAAKQLEDEAVRTGTPVGDLIAQAVLEHLRMDPQAMFDRI